jgi:hypothetical protein
VQWIANCCVKACVKPRLCSRYLGSLSETGEPREPLARTRHVLGVLGAEGLPVGRWYIRPWPWRRLAAAVRAARWVGSEDEEVQMAIETGRSNPDAIREQYLSQPPHLFGAN